MIMNSDNDKTKKLTSLNLKEILIGKSYSNQIQI